MNVSCFSLSCLCKPVRWLVLAVALQLGLTSVCPAQVYERLVSFADAVSATANLGQDPQAGLIKDRDGNFYGTSAGGGLYGFGTIFKVTPAGVLTTLVNFTSNQDVCSDLVLGRDGNLYGTLKGSGPNPGSIYRMTPSGVLTTGLPAAKYSRSFMRVPPPAKSGHTQTSAPAMCSARSSTGPVKTRRGPASPVGGDMPATTTLPRPSRSSAGTRRSAMKRTASVFGP